MGAQDVRLSKFLSLVLRHQPETPETAVIVGQRRGKPVVLTIRAGDMHRSGFTFYRTPNRVWLTDNVPVQYLVIPAGGRS